MRTRERESQYPNLRTNSLDLSSTVHFATLKANTLTFSSKQLIRVDDISLDSTGTLPFDRSASEMPTTNADLFFALMSLTNCFRTFVTGSFPTGSVCITRMDLSGGPSSFNLIV